MDELKCTALALNEDETAHALIYSRMGRGAALLVVIPETTARYGADYTLAPGDRLFPGEGPALTWADWPGFVPAAVEGAALVQYVLPMRLRGKPHHVEAGAWWNGSGTGVRSLTR